MEQKQNIVDFFEQVKNYRITLWFEQLTFLRILLAWIIIVVSFGVMYHVFSGEQGYLFSVHGATKVTSVFDAVYFSFVTATTTGFGDIVPVASFKIIAIAEVIFGLLLLAVVTSKLVSLKQDVILSELYEFSFSEKITRLRSSLLLFRQSLDRMMSKIEDGVMRSRDTNDITVNLALLESTLSETARLLGKRKQHQFVKKLDAVNTELIFNSILSSFEKWYELMVLLDQKTLSWRTEQQVSQLYHCLDIANDLFNQLDTSAGINEDLREDLINRKNILTSIIKQKITEN
ncbi:hypothetical protein HYW21_06975 [Candidatus Woesearchaeota archaeon]|nr:hypothetical protein [Candidatus Woesearchaeota archaeon]